jgi:hypothetical protein
MLQERLEAVAAVVAQRDLHHLAEADLVEQTILALALERVVLAEQITETVGRVLLAVAVAVAMKLVVVLVVKVE